MKFEFPNIEIENDEPPFTQFTGFDDIKKEDDFFEWRKNAIGSSDCAAILGISPYKTKLELWLNKTGIKPDTFTGNYATARGQELEPKIRDWFNNTYGCKMVPERKIHEEFDHVRANADGVDHSVKRMIEIKAGGLEDHEAGTIPEKYYPQCVYLSLIFGYPLDYVSYSDNPKASDKYKVIRLEYTEEYAMMLLKEVHEFWDSVINKVKPGLSAQDDEMIDDESIIDLVKIYEEIKIRVDEDTKELKAVQTLLSERVNHNRSLCNGYRLSWVEKKGNIDYSKVPFSGDVEHFRKKSSKYFTIRKVKSE